MSRKILVLGATGRIGRHAAAAFGKANWQITQFDRNAGRPLADAATGMDVIFNGWNPPYTDWGRTLPELTAQIIDAAKRSGATVMIPGNVYVYGRDMPPRLTAATPRASTHPLGRLRVEMEAAYRTSGVRTILLRAGDFVDTAPSGNWLDRVILAKAQHGRFTYPGPMDRPHAWAFLPDLAARFVALAEAVDRLPPYADIGFDGYTLTGHDLARHCEAALGRPLRVHEMSWVPLHLARPFWPTAKHLLEMRYLWQRPHSLDGGALAGYIGQQPATDPTTALRQALKPQVQPHEAMV